MAETKNIGTVEQLQSHLIKAREGDQVALNDFFHQIEPALWSSALQKTGNYDEAAELVLDTEIKIWQSLSKINPEKNLVGWCLTVERNHWIDNLRSQKARPQATYLPDGEDITDTLFSEDSSPEDTVLTAETHNQLITALNRLSHLQREAIYLAYFRELSHSDIATLTHNPPGTIKTRLRLGLQHLREILC